MEHVVTNIELHFKSTQYGHN